MIIVIADDLTGAAELGGIALRYNLAVEIGMRINRGSKADVLIIATDSRSSTEEAAQRVMEQAADALQDLPCTLVFKKIDSVLRGHVLAEIRVLQNTMKLQKALIVAGNPALGRTIENGVYLLKGVPVHVSSFSQDPEFPVRSSDVHHMLRSKQGDICILKNSGTMPETGIVVGDVKDARDLAAWCKKIDGLTLVAGAAAFFTAILDHQGLKPTSATRSVTTLQLPALMICGSSFKKSKDFVTNLKREGYPVSYLPEEIIKGSTLYGPAYKKWIQQTIACLQQSGKAIIAVEPAMEDFIADAAGLRERVAEATALIATAIPIREYLVEGGSTAAAVTRSLGIETLYPLQELADGVIRMGVAGNKDLHVTVKPGSYDWPAFILPLEGVNGPYEIDYPAY